MFYVLLKLMVFDRRNYILKRCIIKYKPICTLSLVPWGLRLCLNRKSETGNAAQMTSPKGNIFLCKCGCRHEPQCRKSKGGLSEIRCSAVRTHSYEQYVKLPEHHYLTYIQMTEFLMLQKIMVKSYPVLVDKPI